MNQYFKNENEHYYKLVSISLQVAVFMHLVYTTFYDFSLYFWILTGLGTALVIQSKRNNLKNKEKQFNYNEKTS
jgi:hypothetical protein